MTELKLPKELQERFKALEAESGLIDDCRYILELADGWTFEDGGMTIPVRSKKEAFEFLRHSTKRAG